MSDGIALAAVALAALAAVRAVRLQRRAVNDSWAPSPLPWAVMVIVLIAIAAIASLLPG